MGSKPVELEYIDEIEETSKKLKDTFIQAYINLHGNFQGIIRVASSEIPNVFKELVREPGRCYFYRLNMRRDGEWDEILIILCGNTVIASHGVIGDKEVEGVKALEELVKNINKEVYTHGIIETIELSPRLIEEKLGVSVKHLISEAKVEKKEEKPRLVAEEKPPEIEEVVEKSVKSEEAIATIPIESSMTRTESLPEKAVEEEKKPPTPPQLPPTMPQPSRPIPPAETKPVTRKPMVLEEISELDKPVLEFSDKLINILSEENLSLSDAVIQGDPDRLEVEVTITKLGWMKKREKMLRIAENIANILSNILVKNRASQKEITVTVKHGFNAVRISKKLTT